MNILRVLNNNVVLAVDESGGEVILTGWGVGFQTKPGRPVDQAKVQRVFLPEGHRSSDHLGEQLAAIPPDYIAAADDAIRAVGRAPGTATVVALADHLHQAALRATKVLEEHHPLATEVKHLYPEEYADAQRILSAVCTQLCLTLPQVESVAIALHLVNAGLREGDLSDTYLMTGVFSQLFEIIEQSYGIVVPRESVTAARFVTHMRYLFVRARQGTQLREGMAVLSQSLNAEHPEAVACAAKLAAVLALRLGEPLTDDEIAYLALHVARLAG
ncbi:PRD domain-containing protein [Corynebacterium sp.]|uniref:PRD domain-containing protein n=1 Tax=Corynebacterium sp. TaxID=1720 RepID=UPI0026DBACB6|nr:PRD domain-containing protein [Corynebacterium sp.]MDO5076179.1 PRD domain-containing protein [Corynebacterium sp.]